MNFYFKTSKLYLLRNRLTLSCSVGKGPMPTLVTYAFTTPYTSPTFCGGIPRPVQTPPTVQFEEVTKG